MTDDPLKNLPRLDAEALGPCLCCNKVMLASGLPIFYRVTVQHCGIDASAVREHVGLAQLLGGGAGGLALADVMGAHRKPVVVMNTAARSICSTCALDRFPELLTVLEADSEEAGS